MESNLKTFEAIEKQHEKEYDECLERINCYSNKGSFKAIVNFYAPMKESNIERLQQQGYKVSCKKISGIIPIQYLGRFTRKVLISSISIQE